MAWLASKRKRFFLCLGWRPTGSVGPRCTGGGGVVVGRRGRLHPGGVSLIAGGAIKGKAPSAKAGQILFVVHRGRPHTQRTPPLRATPRCTCRLKAGNRADQSPGAPWLPHQYSLSLRDLPVGWPTTHAGAPKHAPSESHCAVTPHGPGCSSPLKRAVALAACCALCRENTIRTIDGKQWASAAGICGQRSGPAFGKVCTRLRHAFRRHESHTERGNRAGMVPSELLAASAFPSPPVKSPGGAAPVPEQHQRPLAPPSNAFAEHSLPPITACSPVELPIAPWGPYSPRVASGLRTTTPADNACAAWISPQHPSLGRRRRHATL